MRNSTIYKLGGPKTFRRASSKMLGGRGSNMQNIEKSLRAIYQSDGWDDDLIPRLKYFLESGDISVFSDEELDKIRIFLQCDQSGAEALIVAYDCEPLGYRKLFIHNVKPHVYVALKLFLQQWKDKSLENGLKLTDGDWDILNLTPIEKLKSNPNWKDADTLIKSSDNWSLVERYYYLAKQTVHSANYDIQWGMFIMNILEKSGGKIVINRDQGEYFLETYRGLFPEIPERNRRIRRQVDNARMLFNFHGHPYQITNYNITESTYKEYYAWPAQSTVGEITRIAFCELQEYIESERKRWDILADTHDSYLVQCPLTEVKECSAKMQEFMNQRMTSPIDGVEFNMKSEVNVGFNWAPFYSANPNKNPLGLREIKWN